MIVNCVFLRKLASRKSAGRPVQEIKRQRVTIKEKPVLWVNNPPGNLPVCR